MHISMQDCLQYIFNIEIDNNIKMNNTLATPTYYKEQCQATTASPPVLSTPSNHCTPLHSRSISYRATSSSVQFTFNQRRYLNLLEMYIH